MKTSRFLAGFLFLLSGIAHAQLTWSLRPLPRDGELGEVTFGAGRFVAATGAYDASGSFVATSTTGLAWQLVPVSISAAFMASSGTNFVVADWGGTLLSSSNGTTWQPVTLPQNAADLYNPSDLSFSGGRYLYLARRYLGEPTYSTETVLVYSEGSALTNWQIVTISLPEAPDCIAYGASRFVASVWGGSGYTMYSSTDGATWSKGTELGGDQIRKIRFLNGRFIAVGVRGTIYVSTDGLNWSKKETPSPVRLVDVSFGKNLYVAIGEAAVILVSTDANVWKVSPFGGHWSALRSISFGGNKFLITGPKGAVLQSN